MLSLWKQNIAFLRMFELSRRRQLIEGGGWLNELNRSDKGHRSFSGHSEGRTRIVQK